MAEWYVRRGEKVIGPFEIPKLKDLAAAGKILPTDLLAKDAAGPWKEAAGTTLFTSAPKPPEQLLAQDRPTRLVQSTERLPVVVVDEAPKNKLLWASRSFFTSIGRGTLSVWSVVGQSLSTRSQRKHELKLAKIQADAMAKAFADSHPPPAPQQARPPVAQPQPAAATQPPITFAPQIVQTTIVKVENKNAGGCSGCAVLFLLILIAIVAFVVYSGANPPR